MASVCHNEMVVLQYEMVLAWDAAYLLIPLYLTTFDKVILTLRKVLYLRHFLRFLG